jgi:hypothetical protein
MSPLWLDFDVLALVQVLPALLFGWLILTAPVSGARAQL